MIEGLKKGFQRTLAVGNIVIVEIFQWPERHKYKSNFFLVILIVVTFHAYCLSIVQQRGYFFSVCLFVITKPILHRIALKACWLLDFSMGNSLLVALIEGFIP